VARRRSRRRGDRGGAERVRLLAGHPPSSRHRPRRPARHRRVQPARVPGAGAQPLGARGAPRLRARLPAHPARRSAMVRHPHRDGRPRAGPRRARLPQRVQPRLPALARTARHARHALEPGSRPREGNRSGVRRRPRRHRPRPPPDRRVLGRDPVTRDERSGGRLRPARGAGDRQRSHAAAHVLVGLVQRAVGRAGDEGAVAHALRSLHRGVAADGEAGHRIPPAASPGSGARFRTRASSSCRISATRSGSTAASAASSRGSSTAVVPSASTPRASAGSRRPPGLSPDTPTPYA